MQLTIDTEKKTLTTHEGEATAELPLYSDKSFELLTNQWLKIGWNQKYSYTFSWMGRPIIQLPEDMIRMQEIIYQIKPDVIIETGIAHGGSLIYYASILNVLNRGRVIGVDIEIRAQNRKAIEEHEMAPLISLIEGSSVDDKVINQISAQLKPHETVLVILDSCHTKQHVLEELEAYCGFVTKGSYVIATDGIMKELHDVPKGEQAWKWDNPSDAAIEFSKRHPEFILENPARPFNESGLQNNITHWPGAWLKKL